MIIFSAFFASSETALSSCNKFRLKKKASEGNKKAETALKVQAQYERVLTGLLIANTVLNILISTIGTVIFTEYFGAMGAGISTIFFTVIMLTFAEIIPKSIASKKAEITCMNNSRTIFYFMIIFGPIISIFDGLRDFIAKKNKIDKQPTFTEQELKFMVEEIKDEGVLEAREGELVRCALDLDEITACEVMTPRVDLISIDINEDFEKIKSIFLTERYSKLPVYAGSIDNVVGVLSEKEFFRAYLSKDKILIKDIIKKALLIPKKTNISDLMKNFQKGKLHMAIVVDQHGGVEGIVTFEDIIEQLVGEIYDEKDSKMAQIVAVDRNIWKVGASASVNEMLKKICLKDTDEGGGFTVRGWVLKNLRKAPKCGDKFIFENLEVEVLKLKNRRILEVLVKKIF